MIFKIQINTESLLLIELKINHLLHDVTPSVYSTLNNSYTALSLTVQCDSCLNYYSKYQQ